jgi:hypothetical protein
MTFGTSVAIQPAGFAPYTSIEAGFIYPSEPILPLEDLIDLNALAAPEPVDLQQPEPQFFTKKHIPDRSIHIIQTEPRPSSTRNSKRPQVSFLML